LRHSRVVGIAGIDSRTVAQERHGFGWTTIVLQGTQFRIDRTGRGPDLIAVDSVVETRAARIIADQVITFLVGHPADGHRGVDRPGVVRVGRTLRGVIPCHDGVLQGYFSPKLLDASALVPRSKHGVPRDGAPGYDHVPNIDDGTAAGAGVAK